MQNVQNDIDAIPIKLDVSSIAGLSISMQIVCILQRNRADLGQKSVNRSRFCIRMMLIKHKFSRVYRMIKVKVSAHAI